MPAINRVPTLNISWGPSKIKLVGLSKILRDGDPSIEVIGAEKESINVTAHMLMPGQVKIVASRIKEELTKAVV